MIGGERGGARVPEFGTGRDLDDGELAIGLERQVINIVAGNIVCRWARLR